MKLDSKQQVLLALYIEYQKDLPKMENVTCTSLNMDIDVFNAALRKLSTEKYIEGLSIFSADNDEFYSADTHDVYLTHSGIEYIEKNFGIKKELKSTDKIKYVIKKCGIMGLQALKMFAAAAAEHIHDVF